MRYGMVGGGPGAFIGAVHRRAAAFDGRSQLVAGAFSSDAMRSATQGRELGLADARVYGDFLTMAEREAALPADQRLDFVVIVTPNHLHYDAAAVFLERGFHVVCDKPLTTTLRDAKALCRRARDGNRILAVTYVYTGYPLIKQARALVRSGALGTIRRISVQYTQGWLAQPIELAGHAQAVWRTDPALAGAGALGDIGVHAYDLMHYVSGLTPARLFADVTTHVTGRRVDDDASVLFQYDDGARGLLVCTQVAGGVENDVRLHVAGDQATLEWSHAAPERLIVHDTAGGRRMITRGSPDLAPAAARASRLPAGHPEGFHDAFANVYANVMRTISAHDLGAAPDPLDLDFPTGENGAAGVHFIETAIRSSRERAWLDATYSPPG
ncbi:MAG: Gfo/Idh/MocA family protein [Longimicrobiales bacterium]